MFGFFSSAMPRYYTPVPAYRVTSTAPVRHFESDEKQQKLHLYSYFTPLFKCNIPNMCQSAVMWCMQSRAAFFLRHSPQRFTFMQYILLFVPSLYRIITQGRKMKHEREENLKLVYKDTMHLV